MADIDWTGLSIAPAIPDRLAEFFAVFGDTTRVAMLCRLAGGECGVQELAEHLNKSQSSISHQLKTLRQCRLVRYRRSGKQMLYALDDEHIHHILRQGLEHVAERM